jgi:transposase
MRLMAEGIPTICIDARHAKGPWNIAPNKTDANDADDLVQLAEVGFHQAVRVKQHDSMLSRTLVGARNKLIKITIGLSKSAAHGGCVGSRESAWSAPRLLRQDLSQTWAPCGRCRRWHASWQCLSKR